MISLVPPLPPNHAFGVDDGSSDLVPSPVLGVGHFSRALVGHSWDLPQFWCSIMARDSQSDQVLGAEAHEREVNRSQRARTYDA